jgi:KDO2-lipid IV(A) lauroyltransferase
MPKRRPIRRLYRRYPALRQFVRRRKDAITYHSARFALWLPRQVSLDRALRIADRIGDLAYRFDGTTRRRALANLDLAYRDTLTRAEKEAIARGALRNAARCFVELTHIEDIRAHFDDYASVEGWEHVEKLLAQDRAVIVITGHIGNWELLAGYFAGKGVPISAIARRINDPRLNQLLVDFRADNGVHSILRESESSSREILRVLRGRNALALVIDQDIMAPSISVPFFGHPARTPVAAAALAVRKNIPVVPGFARRRPEGGHHFTVMAPIMPPNSGDRAMDVLALTTQFNQILEERIRANPSEWVWWHQRWRRKPVPKLDLDYDMHYQNHVLR